MTTGIYIARIPLKYFSDISLDLFPGKILHGRIISSIAGKIRIELGGAVLEATSPHTFQKGEIITLRVKEISNKGVSLEIVAEKSSTSAKATSAQHIPDDSRIADLFNLRTLISKLLQTSGNKERGVIETEFANTLKSALRAGEKHDFFFMVFPIKLEDDHPRHLELLMKRLRNDGEPDKAATEEYVFLITTARLGDITGKILRFERKLRLNLVASSDIVANELRSIIEPLKESITKSGYEVTSVNVRHEKIVGPLESYLTEE